ncbi:MAG: Rpn family recombination-promoting nuclease/putative transposase, partial [Verrucomicrobiales bacterium]|nr:Rpn family recombination-promoting nuclease/putative transposase [Verrucomicrobiales bacterium]
MSDSEDLHQPHDKLFIQGFGDPVNAAALLQTQLPGELAAEIDWKSLKREQGSFIDSQFRSSQTDLLFTAQLAGQRCALYLLFEHQSTPDPWMALRLLRYMVRIWEAFIAKK